jgi:hypothetical protein
MASSLCCAEAALLVAKMMLKPEDVGSYGSCSQVLPKLSTNDYFQSRCIKGRGRWRTFLQQVVLKPHEQAANVFINLQVPRLKQTASQVEYMLLNHSNEKVRPQTFRMKPKEYSFVANLPLELHNNKQTREKSQVVMKGIQLPVVSNNATTGHNFKAAALTAYLSTLGFTKNWMWSFLVFGLTKDSTGIH